MKRIFSLLCAVLATTLLFTGCFVNAEPEYMHPYGEGVDPDSVVTKPYKTTTTAKPTKATTTVATTTDTSDVVSTTTTQLMIPQGYKLCPSCEGVKLVCEVCYGTDKCKVELYDASRDIYVRKFQNCTYCSEEDPGYYLCEVCKNQLYVEE